MGSTINIQWGQTRLNMQLGDFEQYHDPDGLATTGDSKRSQDRSSRAILVLH